MNSSYHKVTGALILALWAIAIATVVDTITQHHIPIIEKKLDCN